MQRPFKFTKLKLITGYILIFLLGAIAIIFIYKQTTVLTQKGNDEIVMQQKLFVISNTLTRLYEAENTGIAFSQTGVQKSFDKYMNLIKEIKKNMDTLKKLSVSSEQSKRIDTINTLLAKRISNLKDLYYVKKYYIPEDFYNNTVKRITALKDSTGTNPDFREKIITVIDSNYIIKEKKGLFRTKRDSILKVDTTRFRIIDTLNMASVNNYPDSLMSMIRESWSQYQQQEEKIKAEVSHREAIVIQSGQHITERLKRVLKDLEREEVKNTKARIEQQQQTTRHLIETISGIAIIACILVTFFIILIINDITQSQRYRKELETAKAYTERLLHNREKLMLTVTHDIKSPLSSIIGYIELLNNTQQEERKRYFLKNMQSSAEHILHLANNLLDFSKLESNKMEINTLPYNPQRLLQEIIDSFLPLAGQKNLLLKSDLSQAPNGYYLGDSMKIRQIIVNILSNAIKYTQQGEVFLSTLSQNTQENQLIITIRDTGPGMTEEEQKLIFKEFTRLTPQHNNGADGTGLGLTITRQLVELLNGQLTLESKKGEGSAFTIKLPLIKSETQEPANEPSSFTPTSHTGIKAFIVDDDHLQLTVTTEFLKKVGIQCTTCTHPQNALSLLEKEDYNIILSDIQMPEMDGFELIRQIRTSNSTTLKKTPVVALSAREDIHEKEYQEAGFSAYLNKPFTPEKLYNIINRLLGSAIKSTPSTPSASNGDAPFDLEMIMTFADHEQEAVNQIIQSFIADCKNNFQLLSDYSENHENEQITKLAHKMLPMFKQLSIHEIIPLLLFLERMPLDTEEAKIKESIEEIRQKGNEILLLLEKAIHPQ